MLKRNCRQDNNNKRTIASNLSDDLPNGWICVKIQDISISESTRCTLIGFDGTSSPVHLSARYVSLTTEVMWHDVTQRLNNTIGSPSLIRSHRQKRFVACRLWSCSSAIFVVVSDIAGNKDVTWTALRHGHTATRVLRIISDQMQACVDFCTPLFDPLFLDQPCTNWNWYNFGPANCWGSDFPPSWLALWQIKVLSAQNVCGQVESRVCREIGHPEIHLPNSQHAEVFRELDKHSTVSFGSVRLAQLRCYCWCVIMSLNKWNAKFFAFSDGTVD